MYPDILLCAVIGAALIVAPMRGFGHFAEHAGSVRGLLYQLEALIVGAVLGFLIAAAAILSTAVGIQRLRVERYAVYKLLLRSFMSSMVVSVLTLVYEVSAFICDQDTKSTPLYTIIGFVAFLLVCVRIMRAVRRLFQSLSI